MQINSQGRSFKPGVELSSDLKSLIIDELYRCGGNRTTCFVPVGSYTSVSRAVRVSSTTVKKVWIQYCTKYTLEGKNAGGDRRSKLNSEDLELIELLKTNQGSISLNEIHSTLEEIGNVQGDISISSIPRALSRMQVKDAIWESIYPKENNSCRVTTVWVWQLVVYTNFHGLPMF